MALLKNQNAVQTPPATTQEQVTAPQPTYVQEVVQPVAAPQPTYVQEVVQPVAVAPAPEQAMAVTPVGGNTLGAMASQGFEGLSFDWTSFPSISLKNEGHFEDFDKHVYGSEICFYVRSTKQRFVYRAEPYSDPRKDVMFTYDKVTTQNGLDVQEELQKWAALGKTTKEKIYLEALVELHAPGTEYDGEFRILSIPPASTGRFSGHMAKASFRGNGDPSSVLTIARVGNKVTGVANAFYPWDFKIAPTPTAAAA